MAITAAAGGGNWSAGATWVGGTAPTAADDAILDATSGAVTVDTTTCVCKTLVCTGYTALLTFTASQKLTISGSCTFAATHTLAGTGTLIIGDTSTITSGALTFPGNLILGGTSKTHTLGDNWAVTGNVTIDGGCTINGNTLTLGGGLTILSAATGAGTTDLIMNGTGTLSSAATVNVLKNNLTINTAGTITLGSYFHFNTGILTYVAGTVVYGTSIFYISGSCTLNTNGMIFFELRITGTSTITLTSDLTLADSLTSQIGTNVMNGNTCYIGGSLTCTVDLSGTTTLVMNGTGTLSSSGSAATLWNNLTVNTAGTITWGTFFSYRTGVFTWTSGTHAGGLGNFYINSNCTLTISSGKIPMALRAQTSGVITLGADLHINSIQTAVSGYLRPEFTGAFNIYADTYSVVDYGLSANGHIFASGTTLTVSTELRLLSTLSSSGVKSTILIGSKTPSSPFYLNYTGTPQNCLCVGVTFVDCDASGSSQEIKNYNGGTLTRCTNIRNVNLPVIPSSVSIGG
jgi:hypothetical protein